MKEDYYGKLFSGAQGQIINQNSENTIIYWRININRIMATKYLEIVQGRLGFTKENNTFEVISIAKHFLIASVVSCSNAELSSQTFA